MDKIVIEGGRPLRGKIKVSGSKNAALPILAATLLTKGKSEIRNLPRLADVQTMGKLLKDLGLKIQLWGSKMKVHANGYSRHVAAYELVKTMRASVLVLGPLVARLGKAKVSLPGGCAIGARPIQLHLKGLEAMGAKIKVEHGYVEAEAKRLRGATIHFDTVTVTGTENLMMAATLAEGTTVLENAAREPEVIDLANFLNAMGAKVHGAGTSTITVEGVEQLQGGVYSVMPDRIEAGTFIAAAVATRGDVTVVNAAPEHLPVFLDKLREAGATIELTGNRIRAAAPNGLNGVDVSTRPFPGFATDLQAQFMTMLTTARGASKIKETVFENRFMQAAELVRMGADIDLDGSNAIVRGVEHLSGAPVMASDLRASAALVIAGLMATRGETAISRVYHIDRGYERIEERFASLGADIERVRE
ncbi:MAG: UDP-N-acetylglucosamine 1-carboxyvinyltransferase [Deltaproteobacteria bacterium]|nr:UDP-N-acetylglucosamine 1-carboxyvinyltransferase [Deltaproteobacteria bacterium]